MLHVVLVIIVLAVSVGGAAAVAGMWTLGADFWFGRLTRRLRQSAPASPSATSHVIASLLKKDEPQDGDSWADRLRRPLCALRPWLQNVTEQAQSRLTGARLALLSIGCGTAGLIAGIAFDVPPLASPFLLLGPASLPIVWLLFRRGRRVRRFREQFPLALESMVNSLRSGGDISRALQVAIEATPEPLQGQLRILFESVNLGSEWDVALKDFARRVPLQEAEVLAAAVRMHRRLGGDMSRALAMVGQITRERLELARQVQSLSAEGRLSGMVLMALPALAFGAVYWLAPDYLMVLFTDETGRRVFAAAVVLQVVGALVIRHTVNIDP